jgi:hypothetical protein
LWRYFLTPSQPSPLLIQLLLSSLLSSFAQGINLLEVMATPGIKSTHTISNHVAEVEKYLSITQNIIIIS